jgi:drug/metabolite transporter (DMT)-like permease
VEKYSSINKIKTQSDFKTAAALVAANFFYGTNVIAVKQISPRLIDPLGLSFARIMITSIMLFLIGLFIKSKETIERKDYPLLILAGFLGITCNLICSIKGISSTNPIHSSLLIMSTPIIVSLLAAVFLKERFGINKILGLALGLLGAFLLISSRNKSISQNPATVQGDLLIVAGSICYSTYLILIRRVSQKYSPLTILRFVFIFGGLFSIPLCFTTFMNANWVQFESLDWFSIIYIIILGTLIANLLMNWGVMKWGPSKTGSFIYFQPLFGTIGAVLLMGESFSLIKLFAGILIIAGVWVTSLKPKTERIIE